MLKVLIKKTLIKLIYLFILMLVPIQVERKRHIGNDIVNIVYVDGGITQMSHFNPAFIKSQFTRIL